MPIERGTAEDIDEVKSAVLGIQEILADAGIRVKIDSSDKSFGWKINNWEMKVRIHGNGYFCGCQILHREILTNLYMASIILNTRSKNDIQPQYVFHKQLDAWVAQCSHLGSKVGALLLLKES